jgi:Tfp pilus assembly protein PilF/peroxiredoxin
VIVGRVIAASSVCALLAAAFPAEIGSQPRESAPPRRQSAIRNPQSPKTYRYHPTQRVPPSLEALEKQLVPGTDAFPDEKEASEIGQRLAAFSAELKQHVDRAAIAADTLMTPSFKGARLTSPDEESVDSGSSLEIRRSPTLMSEFTLDRATFKKELTSLLSEFASIETAEFLVTAIEVTRAPTVSAVSTIRFDLVGPAKAGGRAQRVGHWRLRWQKANDGAWQVGEWSAIDYLRSRAPAPVFTEVTDSLWGGGTPAARQLTPGLDYWASHLDAIFTPRGMGHHGVSIGDVDGDGLDDVYVAQPDGLPNRLFRNAGHGTFEDITESAGVAILDRTSQSIFADIDNDNDQDLVLLTRTGPVLFINDGKGHFTRTADAFQFKQPLQGSLTSAAMADYDRDGFLDLYLCAYGYLIGVSEDKAGPPSPYHDALNGSPNVLLRNDGHGRFVDVTADVGLDENNDRFSFAPAWGDYDNDGWPDLLVANDFGRKNLYHNLGLVNGRVRFTDVAHEAGVDDYGAGMSAAFVDFDNDGRLDIYTGNMWTSAGQRVTAAAAFKPDASPEIKEIYRRHTRGNSLFRNRGDGTFEDVTVKAHAEFGRWAWSSDAFDFDNDGWPDLYVANGMFTPDDDDPSIDLDSFFWRQVVAQSPLTRTPGTPYDDGWRLTNRLLVSNGAQAQHERNVLLRNDGHGGFDEVSGPSGLGIDQDGRAFAVFDFDGDGDSDMVLMAPRASPQVRLFRNDFASGNAAVALRLRGTKSNRDAIGARVTIETDNGSITRVLNAGSGFLSQHSKELVIGLGKGTRITKTTIVWPSGTVQSVANLALNQRTWIEEGVDQVRSEPFSKAGAPPNPAGLKPRLHSSGIADETTRIDPGVWLYQPFPAPDFTLRGLDGRDYSLSGLAGKPVIVCFWASSAPPSRAAVQDLSKQRDALTATGASLLAVAVDPVADEAKVKAASQGLGIPVMLAGEELAGTYNVLHRYLFDRREDLGLPTAFLIDAHGNIVKVYKVPMSASQIMQDVAKIDVPAPDRLKRAVPFPGTFLGSLGTRNDFQYGLELSEQGYDSPALVAFERVAKTDPSAITFYNLGTLYMKRGQNAEAKAAYERALQLKADYADANNSLGALISQNGDVPGGIQRFRAALAAKPQFPDAMNNLGYALFQTGDQAQARELYEKALALQPEFPEALNNLGIFYGTQRDLERAQDYFQQAVNQRSTYGEAANNLALVLAARGDTQKAIDVLQHLLQANPGFEMGYVTLCRIYLKTGQRQEGTQVLERLLQRNPTHPIGLQLLQQIRAGG